MEQIKISAGIVSYNPEIGRLRENINSLLEQCDEVIIVDNYSQNVAEIEKMLRNFENIRLIKNDQNYGIARALNQILELAKQQGYEWIITMDQDSIIQPGLIDQYIKWSNMPNIGIMTCDIMERNAMELFGQRQEEGCCYVKKCITSGSFTNISAVTRIGGFDESYFIDYVDFDLCIRLLERGYRILKINYAGLLHSTGNLQPLRLFGRTAQIRNHVFYIYNESPARIFYFFRNTVFFWRKYGWSGKEYTNPLHIIWRAFLVVAFEHPKTEKIKMIFKGIAAGRKKEVV